jgi:hypothetical protein
LKHVVQGLQDLNTKSLGQGYGKSLEIVVFNELIQIDAQHFKSDANMRPESIVVPNSHNVLAVFMVLISKCLQDFDLNFSLLMEFFPVFQNLDGHMLFSLVIKASQNDTKGSPSQLFLDFISVLQLVLGFIKIIRLIIVKSMVIWWSTLLFGALILTRELICNILANSLILGIQIEVVDDFIISDLVPFILAQMLPIVFEDILGAHGELGWAGASSLGVDELFVLGSR